MESPGLIASIRTGIAGIAGMAARSNPGTVRVNHPLDIKFGPNYRGPDSTPRRRAASRRQATEGSLGQYCTPSRRGAQFLRAGQHLHLRSAITNPPPLPPLPPPPPPPPDCTWCPKRDPPFLRGRVDERLVDPHMFRHCDVVSRRCRWCVCRRIVAKSGLLRMSG